MANITEQEVDLLIIGGRINGTGIARDAAGRGLLAVMPGCAHNAHLEKPALFNMIVDEFLSA